MKKFRTSEDLDEIFVRIPLNKARSILTMCVTVAEKAMSALVRVNSGEVPVGESQKRALRAYADSYRLLRDAIEASIQGNISKEDQEAIIDYEADRLKILQDELLETIKDNLGPCDDPDCETCDISEKIKQEFDLNSLPKGTILSPGSDEEN